jgi:O-antigen ligase
MTDAVGRGSGTSTSTSWASVIWSARHDPAARILNVDLLAVLIAILLPWSTTGAAIAVVLWVVAFGCTVDPRAFVRSLARPICLLPIALFALALLGTLWSDAPWATRLHAVSPAVKLLAIPLLLYHFQRSPRGLWVFIAFLASCVLLMVASWIVAFEPSLSLKLYLSRGPYKVESGIAVRNYIDQGQEFTLCAVALAYPVVTSLRTHKIWLAALLAAVALGLVFNMVFVVVSRTALVTMPVMLAVFALLHLRRRTAAAAFCVTLLLAAVIWNVSPSLRATAAKFVTDYQRTETGNTMTGVGSRLIYWEKSVRFIAEAPLTGHGTGSIRGLFQRVAVIGQDGVTAEVVGDPHNQTLNVAVQWGVVGVAVLYAMWLSHLLLFRGEGLANWIGLLVVVQNIFTSLFNSHLFNFFEGWLYVLGVGVAGGMVLAQRVGSTNVSPVSGLPDFHDDGST